jgi:hypothetical protein
MKVIAAALATMVLSAGLGMVVGQPDRTTFVGQDPVPPVLPLPTPPGVQLLPMPGDQSPVLQLPQQVQPPIQSATIHKQPLQLPL